MGNFGKNLGEKKSPYQNRIELLQGTLDMLILQTLQWGPQHGYGVSQTIRTRSGEVLQVETGSLYPALHRLERQGWVRWEWKVTESNQCAKYYQITGPARSSLHRITDVAADGRGDRCGYAAGTGVASGVAIPLSMSSAWARIALDDGKADVVAERGAVGEILQRRENHHQFGVSRLAIGAAERVEKAVGAELLA